MCGEQKIPNRTSIFKSLPYIFDEEAVKNKKDALNNEATHPYKVATPQNLATPSSNQSIKPLSINQLPLPTCSQYDEKYRRERE